MSQLFTRWRHSNIAALIFKKIEKINPPRASTRPGLPYEMDNASNFKLSFTHDSNPKRVTKWAFIYVKRAKAKNSVISYLGVPRVRNDQCKQCQARLNL